MMKETEIPAGYEVRIEGNKVVIAPKESEKNFESIDNAFRRGREVGFREGIESVKLAEWSEEDEKIRQSIIKDIEFERNYTSATTGDVKVIEKYNEQIAWLKNPHPQHHWKPSEEQMRVFFKANPVNLMPEELGVYHSLCNDLKKLM